MKSLLSCTLVLALVIPVFGQRIEIQRADRSVVGPRLDVLEDEVAVRLGLRGVDRLAGCVPKLDRHVRQS